MTERKQFEVWWNDSDNACRAVNMTWTEGACWFAWQGARANLRSKMKKTRWYSGDQKPVRVGWYERKHEFIPARQSPDFFDGEKWFTGIDGVCSWECPDQSMPWRGLTKEYRSP